MTSLPLRKNPKWRFEQPSVVVKTSLVAIGPGMPKGRTYSVQGSSSCREGTIHNLRRAIVPKISRTETRKRTTSYGLSWNYQKRQVSHKVDLEDPRNKRAGRTTLAIWRGALVGGGARRRASNRAALQFLHVADAIMGPIGVLINPDRPQGCCKASTARNVGQQQLVWHGVDNTLLYSPALVAMFAGLYRQCALLCKAGYADEILSVVDRGCIRETIESADEESAREIIQEMKRWIEVPIPRFGHRSNMVFPPGYFTRLLQISRAVEKHGPRAVFSGGFVKGWALSNRQVNGFGSAQRGLWTAWGTDKGGNAEYKKIAKLSQSRRRNRPACRD